MSAAGQYNKTIEILKMKSTQNSYGEQVDSYDFALKTRARIVNMSASRESVNNETFYTDTKQLTVHMYVPVDEFDHIRINGSEYRILAIIPNEEYNEKTVNIEKLNE